MLNLDKRYLSWIIGIILVLSFLGAAVSGVFTPVRDSSIVSFKSLPPIRASDLSDKIEQLSHYEEQVSREKALSELVLERMVDNFTESYGLKCSEKVLETFLAQDPMFSSERGNFDLKKFEDYCLQVKINPILFKKLTKKSLLTKIALDNLCFSYAPEYLLKAVRNYQLEAKKVCLAELSFYKSVSIKDPSEEELRNIYSRYQQEFMTPEERSIDYCIIKPSTHNVSKDEIDEYFQSNKNAFEGKKLEQVASDILAILIKKKVRDLEMQIYQITEEASNSDASLTLKNIASQYGGKVLHVANISYDSLSKNSDLKVATDTIFKTPKGCLCSPCFSQDSIVICAIKDVKAMDLPPFEKLESQLKKKFITLQSKISNGKVMEAFVSKIKSMKNLSREDFVKTAQSFGIDCSRSFEISNFVNYSDLQIPNFMIDTVLDTPIQEATPVFVNEEQGKFCSLFVESMYHKEENLISLRQIEEKLRLNLVSEFYQYLYNAEEPKIVSKKPSYR